LAVGPVVRVKELLITKPTTVALALSLAVVSLPLSASPEGEIAELRAEMERLRADYSIA